MKLKDWRAGKISNLSIKWKLFFYLILFVAVLLVVLWLFQTVFLESFYKQIKINQIKSFAENLKTSLEQEDLVGFENLITSDDNLCLLIVDENGNRLVSVDVLFGCMIHHLNPGSLQELIRQTHINKGSYLERFTRLPVPFFEDNNQRQNIRPPQELAPKESIIYVEEIFSVNGNPRYLILNSTISPVGSTVEALRSQLRYITLVLIGLALILASVISRKIAQPIMLVNENAKQLATGDYNVEFTTQGYREIEELNQTLNTAAFELSQVENLRRELIANVSHDLRTPLTMIIGFAEVIRDLPGENTPENAQVIVDEAKRLNNLVSDLLDLSKVQANQGVLEKSQFCITKSLQQITARITTFMGEERMHLDAPEEIWVEANEVQISQVIYNLMANALTHSERRVTVHQKPANGWVRIEFKDAGAGIPPEELDYIWERYYKVDQNHKRAQVGTGLGLSIVKGVLDAHQGQYGVESTLGQGSVFWFALPTVPTETLAQF